MSDPAKTDPAALRHSRRVIIIVQGEYPVELDDGSGRERTVTQVIDAAAIAAILAAHQADPAPLLVDADHTADHGGSTEAWAWATLLEEQEHAGQTAVSCWLETTRLGADALSDRRYRYPSPVFEQADLQWLDAGHTRARPLRLARLSFTNRPNTHVPALVNSAPPGALPAPSTHTTNPTGLPSMDYKAKLLALLGLPDDADDATIEAKIAEIQAAKTAAEADAAINAADLPDEAKEEAKKALLAAPAATNAVLGALKAACNAVASHARAAAASAAKPAQRVLLNSQGRQPSPGAAEVARRRQTQLDAHAAANPGMPRDAIYNAVRSTHPELF